MKRLGASLLLLSCLLVVGPSASAVASGQQGWWSATGTIGVPAAVRGPDVPEKGLLIEGGPSGPRSYSAVSATLPAGSALVLDVAPNTVTTADVPMLVCPLVAPEFTPAQGGALTDAPAYDCTRSATITPSGGRYRVEAGSFVSEGEFAVALLPVNATDRIVFGEPTIEAGVTVMGGDPTIAPLSGSVAEAALPANPTYDTYDNVPVAALPVPAATPSAAAARPAAATPTPNLVPLRASLPEAADPVVVAVTLVVGLAGAALWFGARHAAKATVASGP
jgi:hypothetical protein